MIQELGILVTRYADRLEMVQTIGAAIGIIFSLWALLDATKDSMALSMSGVNGARRTIATGNIFTELERLLIHTVLFLVGFASLFLPPPFAGEQFQSPEILQHVIVRFGLLVITMIKVNGAFRSRRERNRFVRQMSFYGHKGTSPALAPPPGPCRRSDEECPNE